MGPPSAAQGPLKERVLLLHVDGLGDVTIPAFGDRTPLEVAHVPFLDAIAAAGVNGLMDPVEPGLACGSDTAHMSIFGYDPRIHYAGRGAFESMGAGISMAPGDIAFKCNFATLDPATGVVLMRRADRNFEHLGPKMCADLDGLRLPNYPEHKVTVRYATEHRCGIAISGPGLSGAVSGTDPLKDNLPLLTPGPEDDTPEAAFTAGLVHELSNEIRKVLEEHPLNNERAAQGLNVANVVLLRGCGCRIRVPSFEQLHGMRAVLVAPTKIIAGLGMSFGMDQIEAPGATGFYNSAFHSKAQAICDALIGSASAEAAAASGKGGEGAEAGPAGGGEAASAASAGSGEVIQEPCEFGFVHVKAVDDTGHDRRVQMKVRFEEVVDRMVGQMVRRLWEAEKASGGRQRFCIAVTGDHSTPVMFGDHSHEPVPFALAHVRHVVEALGGDAVISQVPLGPIPLPDVEKPPSFEELSHQAALQDARRKAAWAGRPWVPGMLPAEVFGHWTDPWPQAVRGDPVRSFDELSAARGGLGRFPGSQVMPIIKAFAGRA